MPVSLLRPAIGSVVVLMLVVMGSSASAQTPTTQTPASNAPDGAALYRQYCRACHGAKGIPSATMQATYPKIPNLADSTLEAHMGTDSILAVLHHGLGKDMKSFTGKLSPAEMAAVAQFVKTLAP